MPAADVSPVLEVNISADRALVEVMQHGRKISSMRNQDQGNAIDPDQRHAAGWLLEFWTAPRLWCCPPNGSPVRTLTDHHQDEPLLRR